MTVPLLDPTKLRRQRQIMGLLLGLVLVMALIAGAALWLAVRQGQQLAQPNLHNELWQTYSLRAELNRTLETAQRIERGEGQPDDLAIRLEVLASLIAPLRRQHLFRHLAEPRPEVQATLQRLIELSDRWSDQAPWGDPAGAQRLAGEISERLPALLEPAHQIVVASNIALTNQLDIDRKHLHRAFYALFWALLGIGAGGALLVLRLVADFRRAQQLAGHLVELNATLERRVDERTRQLSEGKALLHFILEASPSDVVLLSACGARIHYVNPRLLRRIGCREQDDFRLPRLFASASEYSRLQNALEERGQVDGWEAQLCGETPCWAVICARHLEVDGEPATLIWCYDISRRKAMEQELRLLASTDTLTGLHNRHSFLHQAELMLKAAERFHHPCVALMLDIDHFKSINDGHGHLTGDRALQRVAETLRQGLREVDLLGRLGGEEFAAMLPEISLDQALDVAERLRAGVEALRVSNPDGEPLRMTVSIGVALRKDVGDDLESLLVRADSALYQAKSGGRNRTEYTPA
ncbi:MULTISPECIES: sensor domain-containing diguanylate cyclase [Pseudomonas aeruginosa group]|uniref:GGDEF domain-containing protein n=1 Tax=Pseudomonas aeruginosa group TaxID=136841 RepID=UPI0005B889F3|nr:MULTISPECIES: GGDEF domain-containing protein [Pseudomonas aeruginosa group]MDK2351435.1 GGDEF domain-containing protein [Pseudomonas paraeruginosa]MEA8483249.1 GGDEF domain-containing protein [Pseudomonas aeruginosa]